jgi:hypothetical protein
MDAKPGRLFLKVIEFIGPLINLHDSKISVNKLLFGISILFLPTAN